LFTINLSANINGKTFQLPATKPVPPPEDLNILNKKEHKPYMKQRRQNNTVSTNNQVLNRYSKYGGKVEKKFIRKNNNNSPQLANNPINRNYMSYTKNNESNESKKPVPLMSLMDIPLTIPASLANEKTEKTNKSPSDQPASSNSNLTESFKNSSVDTFQSINSRDHQNSYIKTNNKPNAFKTSNERSIGFSSVTTSNSTSISAPPKLIINNGIKTDPKSLGLDNTENKFQMNSTDCVVKKEIKPNSAAAAALEIANRSNTKSSSNTSTKSSLIAINSANPMPDCSKPPPNFSAAKDASRVPHLPNASVVNTHQNFMPASSIFPCNPMEAAYWNYCAQWQTQYWQWASMNQMAVAQKLN